MTREPWKRLGPRALLAAALLSGSAAAAPPASGRGVAAAWAGALCARLDGTARPRLAPRSAFGHALDARGAARLARACAARRRGELGPGAASFVPAAYTALADGALLARQRLAEVDGIALDVVSYASDGLAVGGLLCYPDDGGRHPAVIHVHGGLGGVFDDPDQNMLQTCIDWAKQQGYAALAPSLRGEDGGEGKPELCLGEADDVAAAATLLRSLEMTDPRLLGIVGGSIGGCVALRGAALVPNPTVVVAFVPPTDWKALMAYHRTAWQPAVETRCDGSTYAWNVGGPTLADTFDTIICGHPQCTDADYAARSPIPGLLAQTAPTLIASAGLDNVVPPAQEVLWSVLRQQAGHPVQIYVVDPCTPWGTPAPAQDVLIHVPTAYHLLSADAITSGLAFVVQELGHAASGTTP